MKVRALSGFFNRNDAAQFIEGLQKSKYCDLIILSAVILAFFVLIVISATTA
jgi:hypothetical protein